MVLLTERLNNVIWLRYEDRMMLGYEDGEMLGFPYGKEHCTREGFAFGKNNDIELGSI